MAREPVCAAYGETDARLSRTGAKKLWTALGKAGQNCRRRLCAHPRCQQPWPADFTYCPITQQWRCREQESFDSFGSLLDEFYEGCGTSGPGPAERPGPDEVRHGSPGLGVPEAGGPGEELPPPGPGKALISGELITANPTAWSGAETDGGKLL